MSLTSLVISLIFGAFGPISQFARYFKTYARTNDAVSISALAWPIPTFIGSMLFLANISINQAQNWFAKLVDALPSATLGVANMGVYLLLFISMCRNGAKW